MRKMGILAMVVVFTALVAVPAFGQQEGETDYFEVSPSATLVFGGDPDCGCVAIDCQANYFRTPATSTDITNWPAEYFSEDAFE